MSPCLISGSQSALLMKCVSPLLTFLGPEAVCTTPQSEMACTATLSSLGGLRLCAGSSSAWGGGGRGRGRG